MKIFKKGKLLHAFLSKNFKNQKVGFVPTMGALHKGHLSLVNTAKKQNDIVVVSIFVNPTQFNNLNDLNKYPRTLNTDIDLLKKAACNILFVPDEKEIYPEKKIALQFDFSGLDKLMEGKYRPGHFNGVGTVVKRLFEIVKPTNAYFGEKDFQQLQIIKKMVNVLNLPINIVPCPIFREPTGLALSSRNKRLTKTQRAEALLIYKTLLKIKSEFRTKSVSDLNQIVTQIFKGNKYLKLEYFTIANEATLKPDKKIINTNSYRAFIAVFAGDVRLIDNMPL